MATKAKTKMAPIEITPDMTDDDLNALLKGDVTAPKKANVRKPFVAKNTEFKDDDKKLLELSEEAASAMGDLQIVDLENDEPLTEMPEEVAQAEIEDSPVETICPKCGSVHPLRGLSWGDLKSSGILSEHAVEGTLIERQCARCNFQDRKKAKPMTEEQKAKRREYNKNRNKRLKEQAQAILDEAE